MAKRQRDKLLAGMAEVGQARSDYHMANRRGAQNRRRRGVPATGAGADYHYRAENDWLWMSELAWDLYRNNMALGSITDRAIQNQLQTGFKYDPNTGDEKLDVDLREWWDEVSEDPRVCDPGGELCFADQEEIVLRSTLVAGDILGVPRDVGGVELVEGHRLRSPSRRVRETIVHGVEYVPDSRRRAAYWVLKDEIDPLRANIAKSDLQPITAWEDGERNAFHVRFARRATQTRGITAYAPLFDIAGYHDDVQFLKMVQARAASLFVFVRQRAQSFDPEYLAARMTSGIDVTAQKSDLYESNLRQYDEVAAGSQLEGLPGETINPWSANIPNPEFFPHARLLLTFMGINLGMPLVMALMDASETNFSGYRGAVDQARLGFRNNQQKLMRLWHRPYMRFMLFKRAEDDRAFARQLNQSLAKRGKINVFKHRWNAPAWPYIEPTSDATADLIRDANMLTSPRRRCQERGCDWQDIYRETIEDRAKAYRLALTTAQAIKDEFELATDIDSIALRLAPMPTADKTNVIIQTPQPAASASAPASAQEQQQ